MELTVVPIVKPDAVSFIFGQSHFIKTVEHLHEALVQRFRAPNRIMLTSQAYTTTCEPQDHD
jgi:adenosine/AMP kinase